MSQVFAGALPQFRAPPPLSLSKLFLIMGDLLCRPTYFWFTGAISERSMDRCLQVCNDKIQKDGIMGEFRWIPPHLWNRLKQND